jgi:hypothetical protein
MNDWLRPVTVTEARPGSGDPTRLLYVRSYLVMRLGVGVLGLGLPFLLMFVDLPLSSDKPIPRDSLSAYYFSGVRDYFVGILAVVAIFLISYKVMEKNLDNLLSGVAGLAALAVALFPTAPAVKSRLTPLQNALGEKFVQSIHFVGAAVFIGSLGVLCYFFGLREGRRPPRPGMRHSPRFWRNFHWSCAGAIAVGVVFIPIAAFVLKIRTALLIGEVIAVVSFALSWLTKGFEWDVLRGDVTPSVAATAS